MIDRAERRRRFQRAVEQARRVIHDVWQLHKHPGFEYCEGVKILHPVDEAAMARRLAETHCCPCSCWKCSHTKDVPPKRERNATGEGVTI